MLLGPGIVVRAFRDRAAVPAKSRSINAPTMPGRREGAPATAHPAFATAEGDPVAAEYAWAEPERKSWNWSTRMSRP
jgi:hypothetical protein